VERREAAEQDVEHDAAAPDVGLFAVSTTEDLLRCLCVCEGG
jgi:hypothetical protein